MADISTQPKPHADPSQQPQEQAQKARLEEERRKQLQGHADPSKQVQPPSQTPMSAQDIKLDASHKEAARTHDAGQRFQQFAHTKPAEAPPPSLEGQKVASQPDLMKAAELHRQRQPHVKA
jgi:hypothetical protein